MGKIEFKADYLADDFYWRYVLGEKRPGDLVDWLKREGLGEEQAVEIDAGVQEVRKRESEAKRNDFEPVFSKNSQGRREFNWGK